MSSVEARGESRAASGEPFPASCAESEESGVREQAGRALGARRLLILDDETDFGLYVESVARDIGFSVRTTECGDDFKRAFDEFGPNVVSIDMIMPDVDGVQMLEFLASRKCEARIVIISGFTPFYLHCARELAQGLGLKTPILMSKPVHLKDLREALLQAVG